MKSEKELFGLAQMYVTLEDEYKKAAEYNLYELDEIKEGLENVRDTLFKRAMMLISLFITNIFTER